MGHSLENEIRWIGENWTSKWIRVKDHRFKGSSFRFGLKIENCRIRTKLKKRHPLWLEVKALYHKWNRRRTAASMKAPEIEILWLRRMDQTQKDNIHKSLSLERAVAFREKMGTRMTDQIDQKKMVKLRKSYPFFYSNLEVK